MSASSTAKSPRQQTKEDFANLARIIGKVNGISFDRLCAKLGFCYSATASKNQRSISSRAKNLLNAIEKSHRFEVYYDPFDKVKTCRIGKIWLAGTRPQKELFKPAPSFTGNEVKVYYDPSVISFPSKR